MLSILSSTYFGPVQWYQKLQRSETCLIEQHENFVKQTYRNRMIIATANGPQALTIPTTHGTSLSIKDIRISDHANWRHVHWNALASAYGESPFFPYYQDDLRPFFEKKYEFLFDFTMEGDTTNFFISRKLASFPVSLSVIARGISVGDELEYTDEVTLGRSILNRTPFAQ